MGSLVGQTSSGSARRCGRIDAMAPCVAFVDEVEKALAGRLRRPGDSGVSARCSGRSMD
jgi:SpoVK/Ycf46/Vps4 family AAA+-type ATPase